MLPSALVRFFGMRPQTFLRLFLVLVGGLFAVLILLRSTVWPDLSSRATTILVLGTGTLLMSYRFVLPFAYAWRLRSKRSFWILLAVWLYVSTTMGIAAGADLDLRVMSFLLLSLPAFFVTLMVLSLAGVPASLVRAQRALRQGDGATCRANAQQALADRPDCVEAHLLIGSLNFQEGKSKEALECYRTAALLDPWNASVYSGIGSVHYADAEFEEANVAFERALECQPGVAVHLYNLGLAARMLQRGRAALDLLRRAIEGGLRPELASYAFYASARLLEGLGLEVDVERYYRRATELASKRVVEFWKTILQRSCLIHRVDLRRFLAVITHTDEPPPPAVDEDVF